MSDPVKKLTGLEQAYVPDIYKAHQAIAVVPAAGSRITLLMRRFFNVLLQHAQQTGPMETYRLPLDQILGGAEFNSTNLEVAKNALRGMAKTTVEWSLVRDDGGDEGVERRWGISALIADAEFIEQHRRIYMEWSYSPKIMRQLLDPSRYVQLSMTVYAGLKSGTSAALYEVCMRYLTNAGGVTNKAEWQWWRPRLTGVPETEQAQGSEYKYFKRDTLAPAIKEINSIAGIEVQLIEFKTGRKITHIQFSSRKKEQLNLDMDNNQSIVDTGLMERILAFGVDATIAAKLYASRDHDYVRATIEYVEARVRKGGVDSSAAFFRDAFKKGYGKAEVDNTKRAAKREAKIENKIETEPEVDKFAAVRGYLEMLGEPEKKTLENQFVQSLKGVTLNYYRKHGFKSKIVLTEFHDFVLKIAPAQ